MACVALALRHGGGGVADAPGPGEAVRAEWAELTGRRLAAPVPPEDPRRAGAGPPPSPALAAAAPPDAVPRLEAVRLHELYAMEGGGYRHLDIGVEGLRVGALGWPRLRFKFAVNGEAPQIEVRSRPDWPAMFERWPGGTRADEHGPFLLLTEEDGGGRALARLASERDRRMLAALLRLLPTVVATAARAATADPAEYEGWVAMARRFAGALGEG
jgi:hypothetical protein